VVCPDDVGEMHADLTKVRQALFNLLSNAAKFTSGGNIELRVARVVPEPERVQTQGPGSFDTPVNEIEAEAAGRLGAVRSVRRPD
jgi:signal transduction histidine kinase